MKCVEVGVSHDGSPRSEFSPTPQYHPCRPTVLYKNAIHVSIHAQLAPMLFQPPHQSFHDRPTTSYPIDQRDTKFR